LIIDFEINTTIYPSRELLEAKIDCNRLELKEISTWLKTSSIVKDYEIIYKRRSNKSFHKTTYDFHVLFFNKDKAIIFKLMFGGK
jgi:hypothetical protein